MVAGLKIGQGLFAAFVLALLFKKKDRQGTEQAQIARGYRVSDRAVILVLSAISPMVLAVFYASVFAGHLQQLLGPSLLSRKGGYGEDHIVGLFVDLAFAQVLRVAVDTNPLGYAR